MMGSVERMAVARQGRVAHRLREERRKQGLSLDHVAETLRIRKTYIKAIEGERYAELPGPTYALGFVGSYAQLLDLDRKAIVALFREEFAGVDTETELKFLVPLKEGRFPGRKVLAASIVLAAAVYGGWYAYSNSGLGSGAGTPVANTPAPASQPAKTKPAKAKPAEAKPAKAKPADAAPKAAANKAAAIPAASKIEVAALPGSLHALADTKKDAAVLDQRKARPKVDETTRAKARGKRKPELAAATPASGKARIILKALQDTWVRIRLADGTKVMSRLLKAGDSYAVLKNRGMVLTAGNAGGLRIIVDGRVLPSLGPKGAVRKGIRLDADALLASR